jgi:hypothetical protein
MSDYIKNVDYTEKDLLAAGDPLKIVTGLEWDDEFDEIQTAIATKWEFTADRATVAESEAGTSNTVLQSPIGVGKTYSALLPGPGMQARINASETFVKQTIAQVTEVVSPAFENSDFLTVTLTKAKWYYIELFFDSNGNDQSGVPGDGNCRFNYSNTPLQIALGNWPDELVVPGTVLDSTSDTFFVPADLVSTFGPVLIAGVVQSNLSADTVMTLQINKNNAGVDAFYINAGAWIRATKLN